MMNNDARIDAYIGKSQPFAQPVLQHMRKLVHQASPHITETIKWGAPFFEYKGIIGGMAAFKQHCAFTFMKGKLMTSAEEFNVNNNHSMGQLGKITAVSDLPPDDVFIGYVREAILLNENNIKPEKKKPSAGKELLFPEVLTEALRLNDKAAVFFEGLSYSQKKEYVEWISEAKTEATRTKRLSTTMEWLQEGKTRNWKYQKC